jgi:2-polyprenyl-3-methyl-5-hydroxy-6-metoxy-1,4-benzoquinol methylase
MKDATPCAVCDAEGFALLYDGTLKRCLHCGHVSANMHVDRELLQAVYSENYFKGEEYVDYARDKDVLQYNFARRLAYISSIADFCADQNVVEIGCAYGFFGEVLLKTFPFLNYTGFDVVPEACEYAARNLGLNVHCQDFLEANGMPKSAHVFMWDVIEHLHNPQLYIRKLSEGLADGGYVYLTTGDISALLPRLQKRKWRMIHPPSHLHYFSRNTLSLLLEKYGLSVIRVSYPGTARSLKQIYYSLYLLRKRESAFKMGLYDRIPAKAFITLNTYDIMLVVAQKKA